MRSLFKRPHINMLQEELETVMEVMASDLFIYLDLFVFSLIFTLLLGPVFQSFVISILFLAGSYGIFSSIYFIISRFSEGDKN